MNTLLEDARLLEAGAAAEVRVLPALLDRPGAELLLAPAFFERRVDGVPADDHRGRCGGHRTREFRVVEDVAHDFHGQVALRRLAVAAGAPDVVVEAVLRARPRRVRGGSGRGGHFLGICCSGSLKGVLTSWSRYSETLELARCPEFGFELCAVRSG